MGGAGNECRRGGNNVPTRGNDVRLQADGRVYRTDGAEVSRELCLLGKGKVSKLQVHRICAACQSRQLCAGRMECGEDRQRANRCTADGHIGDVFFAVRSAVDDDKRAGSRAQGLRKEVRKVHCPAFYNKDFACETAVRNRLKLFQRGACIVGVEHEIGLIALPVHINGRRRACNGITGKGVAGILPFQQKAEGYIRGACKFGRTCKVGGGSGDRVVGFHRCTAVLRCRNRYGKISRARVSKRFNCAGIHGRRIAGCVVARRYRNVYTADHRVVQRKNVVAVSRVVVRPQRKVDNISLGDAPLGIAGCKILNRCNDARGRA